MSHEQKREIKHRAIFWIVAIAGVASMILALHFIDLKSLHEHIAKFNAWLVLAAATILPLVGFPVSLLYVVAGARFGDLFGLVIAALVIATQLVCFWQIAHSWLQKPLDSLFRRFHYHKPQVPEGEALAVCLLVALMPGIPYFAKNYLLALSGVPFRYFFWASLPAHFLSATLGILFGGFTGGMTPPKIIFLVCYGLVLTGLSFYVVRRLKSRKELKVGKLKN